MALVAGAQAAPPGRDGKGRERPSESAERRDREARFERGAEQLPPHFRRSHLFLHEGRTAEGSREPSHTLSRHVPDHFSEAAVKRIIEPREAYYEQQQTPNRPDLSVFKDLAHAERAIDATLKDAGNARKIELWLNGGPPNGRLPLEGHHADAVGVLYKRGDPAKPLDMSKAPVEVSSTLLLLQRDGRGGFYIHTAYPVSSP